MNNQPFVCEFDGCNLIFENPIALPCGNSLCQQYLEQFKQNLNFKCYFCQKVHQIPEEGFEINKTITRIMNIYFGLNPLREKIKQSFDELNEVIQENESIIPDAYVYDYFGEIRNTIDLHREQLIKEINDKSNEIIVKLKEKEEKCKLNASKLEKMKLEKLKSSDLPSWKHSLREPDISDDDLNNLLSSMIEKITNIRNETKIYKNDLLMNEAIYFEKYEKSSLFGNLKVEINKLVLANECGKLIKSFTGHSDRIFSIQVDEHSKKLISASNDTTIKIWNLETVECLQTLKGHQNWVRSILISNNKIISGSWDKTIKIWDLNSYECLNTFKNDSSVWSLCSLPNNQIAIGCEDGYIDIWDLKSELKTVESFQAHDNCIPYLLLVDNSKLISCSFDKKIKIWDSLTFECIRVIEGHCDKIEYLDINSDGNLLSCSEDKTVKLWQIETGEMLKSIQFDHPVYCVKALNESLIAVALQTGEIKIYNLIEMLMVNNILAGSPFIHCLNLLSNGSLLSGSGNGEIKLWKIFR